MALVRINGDWNWINADQDAGTLRSAFDGSTGSYWAIGYTANWAPAYATMELIKPYTIQKLRVYSTGAYTRDPKSFRLDVSNTGAFAGEEVTLVTVLNQTGWSNEWREWEFANDTAYKYARFVITAGNNTAYCRTYEVEFWAPEEELVEYGTDISSTVTLSAWSGNPYNMVDDNIGTYWATGFGLVSGILTITPPSATQLNFVRLRFWENNYARAIHYFTLEASMTGAWSGEEVTLITVAPLPRWRTGEWRTFYFENEVAYPYYRMNPVGTSDVSYLYHAEMELMGYAAQASTTTFSTTSTMTSTSSTVSSTSTVSSSSTTTTPPPEYWQTDFRELEVDQFPSGWTEEWPTSTGVSTIRDDGQIGNNCLEIVNYGERYGLSWDIVGSQDDAEILVKVRTRAEVDLVGHAVLRGSGSIGSETCYYACLYASSERIYIRKIVNGTGFALSYEDMTIDANTWYWMRFRVNLHTLYLKVWEDGEAEPGTWNLELDDNDINGVGWVGVGTYYNGPDYDYVSVASNGGTALLPSLTTTTTTVSTTTSSTVTFSGSTTTMSSTSSTASTVSTTSSTGTTVSSTSTISTTSSVSSTTTTTIPPCFWNDNFTGTDGAPPNKWKWSDDSLGLGLAVLYDNSVHLINGGGSANIGILTSKGVFSGDFVVQVDLESIVAPFDNSWSARLKATINSTNYIWIDMLFEEAIDLWTVGYRKSAPEKYPDSVSRTNYYGSLRIARVGSIFYTYYKDGDGSWTEINVGGQNIGTDDVTISFECVSWEFVANFEVSWDNFSVDYDGCPESVTTTTTSTSTSSTTTQTIATTSSTASTTSSTASTTSTFSTTSTTASSTSTYSTTSSTATTISSTSSTVTFSGTTTTFSGTTTTAPPPPEIQLTTKVVVTTG